MSEPAFLSVPALASTIVVTHLCLEEWVCSPTHLRLTTVVVSIVTPVAVVVISIVVLTATVVTVTL